MCRRPGYQRVEVEATSLVFGRDCRIRGVRAVALGGYIANCAVRRLLPAYRGHAEFERYRHARLDRPGDHRARISCSIVCCSWSTRNDGWSLEGRALEHLQEILARQARLTRH